MKCIVRWYVTEFVCVSILFPRFGHFRHIYEIVGKFDIGFKAAKAIGQWKTVLVQGKRTYNAYTGHIAQGLRAQCEHN